MYGGAGVSGTGEFPATKLSFGSEAIHALKLASHAWTKSNKTGGQEPQSDPTDGWVGR